MRRFWMFLWTILLVSQVLSVWIQHRRHRGSVHPVTDTPVELLPLAMQTSRGWPEWLGQTTDRPTGEDSPATRLMRRESLILQLRELETALVAAGVEMDIVEDLQACLASMNGTEGMPMLNQYIEGLLQWAGCFDVVNPRCRLERLGIFPGAHSDYPQLAFELSGYPPQTSRYLLAAIRGGPGWRLDEVDLIPVSGSSDWWLRGSLSFGEDRSR